MKDELDRETVPSPSFDAIPHEQSSSVRFLASIVYLLTVLLILLALMVAVGLLLHDFFALHLLSALPHAPLSAAPLLLVGVAALSFQVLTRPKPFDLFKALLVSLAFMLWGVDQMFPAGWLATTIGDVVIVLYVIDLCWMMGSVLRGRLKVGSSRTSTL